MLQAIQSNSIIMKQRRFGAPLKPVDWGAADCGQPYAVHVALLPVRRAATAMNLAPFRRVVLVERRSEIAPRIGESLVPAARRLLTDMGMLNSFLAENHAQWHGNQIVWGGPERREVDFLRDPDGHGWHLDRARFEQWLRAAATARGAEMLCPAMVDTLEHNGHQWQALLKTAAGSLL
jgi:flavin-dependent dehydrogenase